MNRFSVPINDMQTPTPPIPHLPPTPLSKVAIMGLCSKKMRNTLKHNLIHFRIGSYMTRNLYGQKKKNIRIFLMTSVRYA